MSTWHQQRAMARGGIRLYHETQWTVVIDPPNDCMAVARFSSKAEAEQYLSTQKHAYILKPERAA